MAPGIELPLPPPFIVAEAYEDMKGKYRVLSIEGARMTFVYLDSNREGHSDDIPLKASVHKRTLSERDPPRPQNYQQSKASCRRREYTYEDVTPTHRSAKTKLQKSHRRVGGRQ
jgi:hypothetical protein